MGAVINRKQEANMNEDNTNVVVEPTNEENNPVTYTQEQVNELLQKEADRRVSQALAKAKKDHEKKLSLAKLDEEQRACAEHPCAEDH